MWRGADLLPPWLRLWLGERSKVHCLLQYFYISLEDFSWKLLFCQKKYPVLGVPVRPGGPGPLTSNSIICSIRIFLISCRVKTGEVDSYLKMLYRTLLVMLLQYAYKKVRWGPEIATFRSKILKFSWVIHLNCWRIFKLRRPTGPLVFNINITGIFNYCCTQKF